MYFFENNIVLYLVYEDDAYSFIYTVYTWSLHMFYGWIFLDYR